jgi:hypothetical protein
VDGIEANDPEPRRGMKILTRWLDLVARVGKRVGGDQREQELPYDPLVS